MTSTAVRRCGLAATVVAVLSLIMAPLNALARMRTDDGRSDLDNPLAHWWADPALRALDPIVGWGSPDTVYLTYGKFYVLALLAALACAFAVRSLRPLGRFAERWGWRLTLTSYCLMSVSLFFTYWIANLDLVFLAVTIPALLLSTVGETMLGIGLIRSGFRPRLTPWVLVLSFPLSQALVMISTQALGMWPTMLAWGTAGWSLWRRLPADDAAPTSTHPIAA
jgi:hypothetical protein